MDICSPKDGFVLKVLVHEGQSVSTETPIVQMDTDAEEMALNRLRTMEATRVIRAAQYTGDQLALLVDLAQIAVDKAKANLIPAKLAQQRAQGDVLGGIPNFPETADFAARFPVAEKELQRTIDQQKQLMFAVERHNQIDSLAQKLNRDQEAFLNRKIKRMTILSGRKGTVKGIFVADGSFAELGSVLARIE